jgi:hypothetical protein
MGRHIPTSAVPGGTSWSPGGLPDLPHSPSAQDLLPGRAMNASRSSERSSGCPPPASPRGDGRSGGGDGGRGGDDAGCRRGRAAAWLRPGHLHPVRGPLQRTRAQDEPRSRLRIGVSLRPVIPRPSVPAESVPRDSRRARPADRPGRPPDDAPLELLELLLADRRGRAGPRLGRSRRPRGFPRRPPRGCTRRSAAPRGPSRARPGRPGRAPGWSGTSASRCPGGRREARSAPERMPRPTMAIGRRAANAPPG